MRAAQNASLETPYALNAAETVRVVDVMTGILDAEQCTTYEGTSTALIAAGLVTAEQLASVGKSGVKHLYGNDRKMKTRIKRRRQGLWRVSHWHPMARPPYFPADSLQFTKFDRIGRGASCTVAAALSGPITVRTYQDKSFARTIYTGTREQLIAACLATPSMFPPKGARSWRRAWSPKEQGDWALERDYYHPRLWALTYSHEQFALPKEIECLAREFQLFQRLKRLRGWRDPRDGDECAC